MIETLLNTDTLNPTLHKIAYQVADQKRISSQEAIYLYEHASLSYLGILAHHLRITRHGLKTFFNRNFHLEPTNLCVYDCKFCSYSRLIKQHDQGWKLTLEGMINAVKIHDDQPVTEVHIVGGVLPEYDLAFYAELFSKIRQHRPGLHIKALTPVEFHYIFKKAKISYTEGLKLLKIAGLDSIPGGGAEIFDPEIRNQICKDKCNADQWLEIHQLWHQLGGRSNATMLYGHIEQYRHRVDHMERLRNLQDETGGFQTFIPLKFRNQDNAMAHVPEVSVVEDLRNYAIARIYLDNFDHIKAYWAMIGRETAQLSLNFGVDDLDGTINDTTKIYAMAGAEEQNPNLTTQELVHLIQQVGLQAIERDTLYNPLQVFAMPGAGEKILA